MGQLTAATVEAETVGLYAAIDTTDASLIKAVTGVKPQFQVEVPAVAANAAIEVPVAVAKANLNVTAATLYAGATSAANSSNYATITLEQATVLGVITAMSSGATTASTALTKAVPRSLTITPASAYVAAGNQIVFKVAQTSSGVAVGPLLLVIDGEYV